MKERLQEAQAQLQARLSHLVAFARAHSFWIQCATITLLGLLAAFSYGYAALQRRAQLEERIAELEQVEQGYDRWRLSLRPPGATEAAAWRASEEQLRSIGAEASRPIGLAGLIASRASEVGVSNLQIRTIQADSVPSLDPVALGGWTVQPVGEGLIVEFDAEVAGVMGFLAALPAQAAVSELTLAPAEDVLHARVVIATRQIQRDG